jgi:hypothetical protein
MSGLGDKLTNRLKVADERGGWLKAGYDFGPNNRLYALVERRLMLPNGHGDYVVTAEGRALLGSGWKRKHRPV